MMTTSKILSDAWNAASADAGKGPGYYRRRLVAPAAKCAFAGIVQPEGRRQLSFEVTLDSRATFSESTRGYSVQVERPDKDHPKYAMVHISESFEKRPDPIFTALCCDLVQTLTPIGDASAAGSALIRRIQLWRLFFRNSSEGGLTLVEAIGLFGELAALLEILREGEPPETVIRSWTGPLQENQDFTFGERAMEVKCSTSNDADSVQITNARQLDGTGLAVLLLRHSTYDLRAGGGTLLAQLIQEIREALVASPQATAEFDERLLAAGYCEPLPESVREAGFTLRRHRHFKVSEGFPRLLESVLPNGVSKVAYTINLAACAGHEISERSAKLELLNRAAP